MPRMASLDKHLTRATRGCPKGAIEPPALPARIIGSDPDEGKRDVAKFTRGDPPSSPPLPPHNHHRGVSAVLNIFGSLYIMQIYRTSAQLANVLHWILGGIRLWSLTGRRLPTLLLRPRQQVSACIPEAQRTQAEFTASNHFHVVGVPGDRVG